MIAGVIPGDATGSLDGGDDCVHASSPPGARHHALESAVAAAAEGFRRTRGSPLRLQRKRTCSPMSTRRKTLAEINQRFMAAPFESTFWLTSENLAGE